MLYFVGEYYCKIDTKGRILLPSSFKKQINNNYITQFVIKKSIFELCLLLYPLPEWEKQILILREQINPFNKEHVNFLREFYKGTAEISLDNNNRILIPKRLAEWAKLKDDVVLLGQDNKIAIWDKNTYESSTLPDDEFAKLAEKIFNNKNKQ